MSTAHRSQLFRTKYALLLATLLAATNELMSLHVNLATRRGAPMAADVLARLADILSQHETLPVPPQVGRRIGLDARS